MASAFAVTATLIATALASGETSAAASETAPVLVDAPSLAAPRFVSQPLTQALPEETEEADTSVDTGSQEPRVSATSLFQLVSAQPQPAQLSREMHCLAGAIYFESRGESLAGQLAVGRVIVSRSRSGRFPDSYCGVVFQRSQFSFVRGSSFPAIRTASASWKNAVAIAQIAHGGGWKSQAEGALFFHASHVRPSWNLTRVARVDNHVFYR